MSDEGRIRRATSSCRNGIIDYVEAVAFGMPRTSRSSDVSRLRDHGHPDRLDHDVLIAIHLAIAQAHRLAKHRRTARTEQCTSTSQRSAIFVRCRPTVAEQRAIATALSDVDALLGGLDRLIAKKRDLKQAAMQQLLTGQTRLPGFHGEWEVKRLARSLDLAPASARRSDGRNAWQFNCDRSRSHTMRHFHSRHDLGVPMNVASPNRDDALVASHLIRQVSANVLVNICAICRSVR